MESKNFRLFVALLLIVGTLNAQQNENSKKNNIFEALSIADSLSQATVTIHQDKRIELLLANKKQSNSQSQATISGFRVQVFSGSVQRTAKNNAFKIENQIYEIFPDLTVYVNYTSPFWKVRVGDFKTISEAQTMRDKLIEAFPTMKSEIYIVPEQVLISISKTK